MAIPNFVAAESDIDGGKEPTVNIPSGASAGDRLLLICPMRAQESVTVPTGWTPLLETPEGEHTDSAGRVEIWTAVATSGGDTDPGASVTVNLGSNSPTVLTCLAYEASDVIDWNIDTSNGDGEFSWTTTPIEALGECRALSIYGGVSHVNDVDPAISWTPDAATTERMDNGTTPATGGSGRRQATLMVADESISGPGMTTGRTAVPSAEAQAQPVVILLGADVDQPTANAGTDQVVTAGATVNLSGTASGGAGEPYTYKWSQVSGPTVSLNDDTAQNPSFTAPGSTSVVLLQLVVEDVDGVPSPADTVMITISGAEDVAVPVSDVANSGGWTTVPGDASSIAEVLADNTDATYAISPPDPSEDGFRVNMSELTDGSSSDTVILAFRARLADGATSGTITGQLIEGESTVIATLLDQPINGTNWQQFILTFTPAEIESVSVWGDVDFAVFTTAVS